MGVVFSGGGARAYAHIGVVKAMRELGIPIDFAGGASMGAVVAGCVAMGIKMWAARLEVDIQQVEVCFSTDVDARGQFGVCDDIPPGFERAELKIRATSDAPEGEVRNAIDSSLRYSPIIDVVKDSFPIETQIEIKINKIKTIKSKSETAMGLGMVVSIFISITIKVSNSK